MTENEHSRLSEEDQKFKAEKIDPLLDSTPYKEKYKDPDVQELMQALEILNTLQLKVTNDASQVPWKKLIHAKNHLDKVLAKHLEGSDQQPDKKE